MSILNHLLDIFFSFSCIYILGNPKYTWVCLGFPPKKVKCIYTNGLVHWSTFVLLHKGNQVMISTASPFYQQYLDVVCLIKISVAYVSVRRIVIHLAYTSAAVTRHGLRWTPDVNSVHSPAQDSTSGCVWFTHISQTVVEHLCEFARWIYKTNTNTHTHNITSSKVNVGRRHQLCERVARNLRCICSVPPYTRENNHCLFTFELVVAFTLIVFLVAILNYKNGSLGRSNQTQKYGNDKILYKQ